MLILEWSQSMSAPLCLLIHLIVLHRLQMLTAISGSLTTSSLTLILIIGMLLRCLPIKLLCKCLFCSRFFLFPVYLESLSHFLRDWCVFGHVKMSTRQMLLQPYLFLDHEQQSHSRCNSCGVHLVIDVLPCYISILLNLL